MAKVKLNKLIESLRGRIGDLVFREMPHGEIYTSSAPKKMRRSTLVQKVYRQGIVPPVGSKGNGKRVELCRHTSTHRWVI